MATRTMERGRSALRDRPVGCQAPHMETISAIEPIRIRVIEPGDHDALLRFYSGLSADSLARRFHGVSNGIADRAAAFFCGPDHEHREGLVAVMGEPRAPRATIVGHLCLEPRGVGEVETAVAVADAWQRHGIGRRLLQAAVAWGELHGIRR